MTLLLDSHIVLAVQAQGSVELTTEMRNAISASMPNVYVSTASHWEIARKYRSGRFELDAALEDLADTCQELDLKMLSIEPPMFSANS